MSHLSIEQSVSLLLSFSAAQMMLWFYVFERTSRWKFSVQSLKKKKERKKEKGNLLNLGYLNTNRWPQRGGPRLLRLSVCLEMSTCVQYDSLLAPRVLLHARQAFIFAHYGQITISAWGTEPPRSGQKKVPKKKKKTQNTQRCPSLQCATLVLKPCKVPNN